MAKIMILNQNKEILEGTLNCIHDCLHCISIKYINGVMTGICDNPDSAFYANKVTDKSSCYKIKLD